ncbi:M48 family metallopeptidase [Alkaliphilus pronyensis]|uniref:M48 family metallopeptidase n=1 Tax=Alkaliphilus pronyensis TaxID=1482732 RepID=A0A6I0FBU0_9FIRM|nr:SprT family zinc-dependent metalloprotease [Alkaliphilus pronyensis]KAB3536274.1 M48 family metallopeptidase [Alkaliphilus pronyensis]
MDIKYEIRRSKKRKKLTINIERDRRIVVLAPENTSDEKIRQVIDSKKQWIHEKLGHPQKFAAKPHAPGKEIINGESLYYLGHQYQVELIESTNDELVFDNKFLFPMQEKEKNLVLLKKWYVRCAKEKIIPRARKFAKDLGVEAESIKIVDNKYRWGSCTTKNNINISWRLMQAPMFVIDYIIIHELAHLIEANHTPEFWNIVKAQLPKMEKAKLWLKENGQRVQEEL